MTRRQKELYEGIMKNMQHQGNTRRTDKALKILQEICKENKKYENDVDLGYTKVNDDSDESYEESVERSKITKNLPPVGNNS